MHAVFYALTGALTAWAVAALYVDGPSRRSVALALCLALLGTVAAIAARVRPPSRAAIVALGPGIAVLGWWLSLTPRNDRDWQPDVARLAAVERAGRLVTVRNVRDFDYRSETDLDVRWEDRVYDLDRVSGLDLFLSFWGPTLYAHTILSWQFGDQPPLAVSIETRKEKGENYSALRGFFRQYELIYVLADERDVVRLRTTYRGETVYLYRLALSPVAARALLLQYFAEVDALRTTPRWYNALTVNCTTAIWRNVRALSPANPFDWRLVANGYLDRMLHERGTIDTSRSFEQLKEESDISSRAIECGREDFSRCIRAGLPVPALPAAGTATAE